MGICIDFIIDFVYCFGKLGYNWKLGWSVGNCLTIILNWRLNLNFNSESICNDIAIDYKLN